MPMVELDVVVRTATPADIPGILQMQRYSMSVLSRGFYSDLQIASFLKFMPTLEQGLVADATFYVAESAGRLAGCGGWSAKTPAYHSIVRSDVRGAGVPKVRAMYVHPEFARRGIGSALLGVIEQAISNAGYAEAALDAMLTAASLYRRCGYRATANSHIEFPDGVRLPVLAMHKHLAIDVRQARKGAA
jgi:GNAT superfamily N-acetyltransferase